MKTIYLSLSLLFLSQLSAKTYHSFQKGDWSNKFTWLNGDKPAFSFSDTIYISHYVTLDSSLYLKQGAYLKIDSSGSLCGHKVITGGSQSLIYKYGLLQVDSIFLIGGKAIMDGPEPVIVWRQISISGTGASYYQKGGQTEVGPWFECKKRPSETGLAQTSISAGNLYPNPNGGIFTFTPQVSETKAYFELFNSSGILVAKVEINGPANINLETMPAGLYYWVYSGSNVMDKGSLVITR